MNSLKRLFGNVEEEVKEVLKVSGTRGCGNQKSRKKPKKRSMSGAACVQITESKRFSVKVHFDGRLRCFGTFKTLTEAITVRDKVWAENGFSENHCK